MTISRTAPFKELLKQMGQRMGGEHYGTERRETDEQKAEEMVAGGN